MTYEEVLQNARTCMGDYCKACPSCNGKACGRQIPGPGAKGSGTVAIRNYDKWQEIRVNMDTICENKPVDTSFEVFGKTFKLPVFAAPIGSMKQHYGEKYDDMEYNNILVPSCAAAGIAAFTGDGLNSDIMIQAANAIANAGGMGIPTVKPWDVNTLEKKFEVIKKAAPLAVAMDIDAAGLPFLQNMTPPAGSKTVEELQELIQKAEIPFILKGIMTVKGAQKARAAGASAIVVSNHGGRVLDQCPATAEVLEEIAAAVGSEMKIFVDGGIRSGMDVFKALALGADGVLIGRPYVTAVYGGAAEGIHVYTAKIAAELKDAMAMCGAHSLADISRDMVKI